MFGHVRLRVTTHGSFQTSPESFDRLMAEYLPASPAELRAKLQRFSDEQHGSSIDYSDLTTVTECLMVLAELRGFATN
ncbi:hypothetical protein [Streptomyces sp. NRRL F-5123]|uniref:hypothetical protein n=1 Tax=Streptomyces sp. NRRL F-5123 TaxID=1463856 RepID=UPI0004E10A9A|nr:hypothetical protein [Streptomyces sp. NRRL F-5123]